MSWSDDQMLLKAIPERHPCMEGYPGKNFFNYDYQMVRISDAELDFLQACDRNLEAKLTVEELLKDRELELSEVRSLQERQLIILSSN